MTDSVCFIYIEVRAVAVPSKCWVFNAFHDHQLSVKLPDSLGGCTLLTTYSLRIWAVIQCIVLLHQQW